MAIVVVFVVVVDVVFDVAVVVVPLQCTQINLIAEISLLALIVFYKDSSLSRCVCVCSVLQYTTIYL